MTNNTIMAIFAIFNKPDGLLNNLINIITYILNKNIYLFLNLLILNLLN